jgi:signal transduction histidine kinase
VSAACRPRRAGARAVQWFWGVRLGIPIAELLGVDLQREHRDELERLALRRLPLAMGILALFIGGALPIELNFYPDRLIPYLAVYAVELVVCVLAWAAALRWPSHARAIATAWGALLGFCVAAYYPIVQADATLAMAALICLVTAIPATLPFGVWHQLIFGLSCALSFIGIFLWGLPMSLPWQYTFIALLAVLTTSTIGARTISRFRREAFEREAILRQAHEQLRIALGRAEDTVELKTRLVANVSHELRTPLNVIVGYTDMLLDADNDRDAVADAAPRIRQYAVSLEALVSELLDLSRLTCGKVELTCAEVEVRPLLEEAARGARVVLQEKPVRVEIDCQVARIVSDPMRLQQILTNLGTNAAKFTDEGSITIAAYTDQDTVAFVVRDTGCGIPAAQHESIFDAFEQGATEPGRKTSGIGLGLAIVRQLTDILGGSVSVASTPGAGSTFTVRLPLVVPSPRVDADESSDLVPMRRAG